MTFADATDAPIVVDGTTYPKLKLRAIAGLAAKYQSIQLAKVRKMLDAEKSAPEVRARILLSNVGADYAVDDVHQWAISLEGSVEIVKASVPTAAVDDMDASILRDIAMEVVDHPNSARRRAQRERESKAADAEKKRVEAESSNLT